MLLMPSSRMYAHPDKMRVCRAGARASWARTWQSTLSQLDRSRPVSAGSLGSAMLPAYDPAYNFLCRSSICMTGMHMHAGQPAFEACNTIGHFATRQQRKSHSGSHLPGRRQSSGPC